MAARFEIHWMTEAGMFFEKTGPVWETLRDLEQRLDQAGIPYVIIGGMALNAYHYPRQTVDVDVVLRKPDHERFLAEYLGTAYEKGQGPARRLVDAQHQTHVDVLISGELAGRRSKNQVVRFPDPSEGVVQEDLRTVTLPRLIELKLVTWRYKDWGDVVELIRRHQLPEPFADQLQHIVRSAYLQCWDEARDENYEAPEG
jgi:hypothetical protein